MLPGWFDTVVIDPGHGEGDEGVSGHGLKEKNVTLNLGQKFARELQKQGFRTLLKRDTGWVVVSRNCKHVREE